MASKCLETYIKQIRYGDDFPHSQRVIFNAGSTHHSPILKAGCINRILLYPGSFNPPHLGHFELLRHGFWRSGRDMNLVAAIVVPLDDNSLRFKFRRTEDATLFTQADRIRLWNGCVPSDWYWTYDRSMTEWFDFKERLTAVISQDGFNITWTALTGPDLFKVNEEPPVPNWDCEEVIVSNVGRAAYFAPCGVSGLTTLSGCDAWRELILDNEPRTEDESIRVCRRLDDP